MDNVDIRVEGTNREQSEQLIISLIKEDFQYDNPYIYASEYKTADGKARTHSLVSGDMYTILNILGDILLSTIDRHDCSILFIKKYFDRIMYLAKNKKAKKGS